MKSYYNEVKRPAIIETFATALQMKMAKTAKIDINSRDSDFERFSKNVACVLNVYTKSFRLLCDVFDEFKTPEGIYVLESLEDLESKYATSVELRTLMQELGQQMEEGEKNEK